MSEEVITSKVTIMSLPIEVILLIINKLDFHSYRVLSTTCSFFYDILCCEEQLISIYSLQKSINIRKFLQKGSPLVPVYKILFKEKIKICHFELSNYYPFRVIANNGYYGVMKYLFEQGLNYEAIESDNCSILVNAIKRNSIEMFEFLLNYGLSKKHISLNNLLIYREAIKHRRNKIIIFFFEKLNIPIDYVYTFDNLLLRYSFNFDDDEIIKFLIKNYHEIFDYRVFTKLLKKYDAPQIRKIVKKSQSC